MYLYSIECCGSEIDIYLGVIARCGTCNCTFLALDPEGE